MIIPLRTVASKYALPTMTRVVHIGGHFGEECDEYFREGAITVRFFEPQDRCYEEMVRRLGDRPNVSLVRLALGSHQGRVPMYTETFNGGQSSSLLKAKVHATQYPQIVFDGQELVTMMRLDDHELCAPFRPDFMAIDVQGYELEVFRGSVSTLRGIQAISAEINRAELYEGCGLVGEVDAFLAIHGFERVETEWCGDTWGEGIYVRRRDAVQ